MTLVEKMRGQITKQGLFNTGDRVLVALSGGADSVSLLLALCETKNYAVCAAHVNHGLRKNEADRDEQFCAELCEKLSVPFFCAHIDVPAIAKARGVSFETAARDERYAFLSVTANRLGAVIATAHTANDNLETVLFNMGRGCGTAGLCGIPQKRGEIVRPLLTLTREEIEEYLKEKNQPYCVDSTNLSDDCTRNMIRHNVVPELLKIFPDALNKITRMTSLVACDERFIKISVNALINAYGQIGIAAFVGADPAIASRAALYLCEELCGGRPEAVHIDAVTRMIETGRGECALPGNCRIVIKNGRLTKVGADSGKRQTTDVGPIPLTLGEYPLWDGKKAIVKEAKYTQLYSGVHKNATYTAVRRDIMYTAEFRTRQSGDSVNLPRRHITKPLKKLFNELKIPHEARDRLPVLANGSDVLLISGTGGLTAPEGSFEAGEDVIIIEII